MADLASFWVGDRLGPIEIASLRSFLRHGDRMTVYSPTPLEQLPDGVLWRDAGEIMSCDRIIRHRKTGSPALHSDLFRYQLMAKTGQIWVDLDVIALRPFDFGSDWVFGYETPDLVAMGILRLPRTSRTLQGLLSLKPDTVGFPPYLSGLRLAKYWLRTAGRGLPLERWPWGGTGPRALTHYLRQSGEIAHALPVSAFYSVPLNQVGRFLEPGALTLADLPPDAWAVHLWGKDLRQAIARQHAGRVPAGCFLDLARREEL